MLKLPCRCIIDTKPRKLQAEQYKVLTNFAEMAVRQLEKDHHLDLQRQVASYTRHLSSHEAAEVYSIERSKLAIPT